MYIFSQNLKEQKSTNNPDSDPDKHHFLLLLKEAITDTSTGQLWKNYAMRLSMQFKDYALESKVNISREACSTLRTCLLLAPTVREAEVQ